MNRPSGTKPAPYTEAQSKAWLIWLARNMQSHGKTVFMLEELQPSWLLTRKQRFAYILVSRMVLGLGFNLVFGAIIGLILMGGNSESVRDSDWILAYSVYGLALGFLSGVLTFRELESRRIAEIENTNLRFQFVLDVPKYKTLKKYEKLKSILHPQITLCVYFLSAIFMSLLSVELTRQKERDYNNPFYLVIAVVGLINEFCCLRFWCVLQNPLTEFGSEIRRIETIAWSWRNAALALLWILMWNIIVLILIFVVFPGLVSPSVDRLPWGSFSALPSRLLPVPRNRDWYSYAAVAVCKFL